MMMRKKIMSKCVNCGNEILTGDIHWEMGLCNNCYNELYKKTSCVDLLNREMDGLLDDYAKRRIADLEAKLAEKEEMIEKAKRTAYSQRQIDDDIKLRALKTDVANKENCIKELKQQLAEKDEQIKVLKLDLGMFKSVNEFLNGYGIEKAREVLLQTEKTKNQDKISFAVEQLVNIQKYISDNPLGAEQERFGREINDFIDNQIDALRNNKYGKH